MDVPMLFRFLQNSTDLYRPSMRKIFKNISLDKQTQLWMATELGGVKTLVEEAATISGELQYTKPLGNTIIDLILVVKAKESTDQTTSSQEKVDDLLSWKFDVFLHPYGIEM